MAAELCRHAGVPVKVLWHSAVAESFTCTDIPANVTRQALHICGDHAYVYGDPHTKQWITRHHAQTPGPRPAQTMQIAPKAAKTSFEDWAPLEQVTRDLSGHFYADGERGDAEGPRRVP